VMSTDTLSEVLRAVRLNGAVWFRIDASGPFTAEAPPSSKLAPLLMPGAEHVIEYHVVTRGSCFGGIVGQTPVELHAGDIIVFPQGDPHVISSAPGMRALPTWDVYRHPERGVLPIALSMGSTGPLQAELVCGFLGCDARPFNPLLATLPRLLHVPRRAEGTGHLASLVRLAVDECETARAGSQCMLARLSELLFVEVVRWYVATLPHDTTGWLAGLRDEFVGRALSALHDRPRHAWTLDDLAREVGLSRSILAERFQHYVGTPPMQYLARWRIQLAAALLSSTMCNMAEIADRVGYGSEAALSRAFKRWVGLAPSAWRAGERIAALPEG
jgi:AraC-like DNA-binding protein